MSKSNFKDEHGGRVVLSPSKKTGNFSGNKSELTLPETVILERK